jgi:hypothetical protein
MIVAPLHLVYQHHTFKVPKYGGHFSPAEFKTSEFFDRGDPGFFPSFNVRGMVLNPRHVSWYCVRRIYCLLLHKWGYKPLFSPSAVPILLAEHIAHTPYEILTPEWSWEPFRATDTSCCSSLIASFLFSKTAFSTRILFPGVLVPMDLPLLQQSSLSIYLFRFAHSTDSNSFS